MPRAKTSGDRAVGCQAVPERAARRMAARLVPPMIIGMWGFCTGLGVNFMPEKLWYLPWKLGSGLVQSSFMMAMVSSVMAPRSA